VKFLKGFAAQTISMSDFKEKKIAPEKFLKLITMINNWSDNFLRNLID
jgi:hypothetical protein